MQVLGPAPAALTQEQILAQYGSALDQVVKAATDPQYEFERTIQINKARRNWQFVRGNQLLAPGMINTPYGEIADYIQVDSPGSENGADVKFLYPINVIGGDLYKFMAVMGNSAPRVKAVADDPQDAEQIEQARNADATIRDLWQKWRADQIQRTLAFHQYTTGPTFLRTTWVTDRLKYGQSVEPKMTIVPQPQPDGSMLSTPVQDGVTTYENGDCELHVYSILEIEGPFMAKSLDSMPWLRCRVNRSKWDLLSAFKSKDPTKPGPLEKYRTEDIPDDEVTSTATSANEAREAVSNPSGTGRSRRPNQWTFTEDWYHPSLYEAIEDAEARAVFQRQYPDGLYLARVGSIKAKIDHRKLTDDWAVCKTGRGEKIFEDPICNDSIPIQRALNDLLNLAIETVLRAIAQTIVDSQLLDRDSMAKKEALPAELIFTTLPVDGDLAKRIFQIPPARVSDQLVPLFTMLRSLQQEITGIRPELSGGGVPTQTYREAKQRKDQALLQLSPQAQEMQFAWTVVGENGVKTRSRYASGLTKVPRKGSFGPETDVVDNARLSETGWHCEADDNFPMSNSDRFDKMWALLKEFPPEVQAALSILDPINLEETLELLQIPGFESVTEDQKRKTLIDIGQLLATPPPQPGPDGQLPPPQIDAYDDHAFVSDFMRKWMVSKTGQDAKQTSPDAFAEIGRVQAAHFQASQPPQPPPPPLVRPSLSVSAKLEDMPPQFTDELLQGAGLPALGAVPADPNALAPPSVPQPGAIPTSPNNSGSGSPAQGGHPPKQDAQESPLPPPPGLEGPNPPAIQ